MNSIELAARIPALEPLLHGADHLDVKSFASRRTLPDFLARMLGYTPWWLGALFKVRQGLAKLLGLAHVIPEKTPLGAADIDFSPGAAVGFFTTVDGSPDSFWIGEASDKHLRAFIGVVAEPGEVGTLFHVLTIVHYRHWTGPVYFNLIRPFHHLIVHCMGKYAAAD